MAQILTTQKKIDRLNYLCENERSAEDVYPVLLDLTKTLLSYIKEDPWFEDIVQDVCIFVLYESKVRKEVAEGKKYGNFWRSYLVRLHQRFLERYTTDPENIKEHFRLLSTGPDDSPFCGNTFYRMTESHLKRTAKNGELLRIKVPATLRKQVMDPVKQLVKSSSMDFLLDVYSRAIERSKGHV